MARIKEGSRWGLNPKQRIEDNSDVDKRDRLFRETKIRGRQLLYLGSGLHTPSAVIRVDPVECVAYPHAQTRGAIYIDRGQVLHAEFGAARGRQAFFEACLLERGRFRFWPSIAAPTTSIDESGIELLMTLTQCIDQARHATDTPKPTRVGSGHNRSGHR